MCTQTKVVGNLPEECILYSHEIQLDSLFFPLENIESDSPHLFGFQSFDQGWKMNDLPTADTTLTIIIIFKSIAASLIASE